MLEILKKLFIKNYESLNGQAFRQKYRSTKNAILLDVRTPGEFKNGSIRGARNINYLSPTFVRTVETLDKEKTYFLMCRSGSRSGSACSKMSTMGFKVYNLSGGIGAWKE